MNAEELILKRIGRCLIEIIEGIVFGSSTPARFLVVDAINNPRAIKFYENMGFIDSIAQKPQTPNPETICMFRDLYSEDQAT